VRGLSLGAFVAVVVLAGCGAHPVDDRPSLDEVAGATRADPYRFEFSLRAEGLKESFSTTASGAADPASRRGTVRYVFEDEGEEVTSEVRQVADVTYSRFTAPEFPEGWTKAPTTEAEGVLGPFGGFFEPHHAADALARHGRDVEAGPGESVDGLPTTRYRATIETVELLGAGLTESERKELQTEVRETQSETATVEAWAGSDGVLRRLDFTVPFVDDGQPGRIFSSTRFFDFGKPVAAEAPPAAEIVESVGGGSAIEPAGPCRFEAAPHSAQSVIEALDTSGFSVETSCDGGETIIYALLEEGGGDDDAVLCSVTRGPEPTDTLDAPMVEGNVACVPEPSQRARVKNILAGL
jgi:hypothetical protein